MFIIIGISVGLVMGITGAGGALIAIPLFMHFLEMPLKEASVYSLLAVVIASLSNFYHQRNHGNIKLASILVVSSAMGSFLSLPYKKLLPEIIMAVILALVALYSLYTVWFPTSNDQTLEEAPPNVLMTITIGLFLGVLTTFTGLGGGVLMLPIFLGIYHLSQRRAVVTSLVVVGLSSLMSFLIQIYKGKKLQLELSFIGLILGILISSYLLKIILSKMSQKSVDILRKTVFTLVVAIALLKIMGVGVPPAISPDK